MDLIYRPWEILESEVLLNTQHSNGMGKLAIAVASLRLFISSELNQHQQTEPISKSFKQYQQGCELHKAQEVIRIVLPARHNTALPLEPGKKALDLPPPRIAT